MEVGSHKSTINQVGCGKIIARLAENVLLLFNASGSVYSFTNTNRCRLTLPVLKSLKTLA